MRFFGGESGAPGTLTQTGGGKIWRALLGTGLVAGVSYFLAAVIATPSKRNIEALAGLVFMGFMMVARPYGIYLFTLALIPFPAQTSVASTSMLLIVAMTALIAARARHEHLESPFIDRQQDFAIMGWGVCVLVAFYGQNPEVMDVAVRFGLGFLTAVMLYYATITLVDTEAKLVRALKLTQILAVILAGIGIAQWLFPDKQVLPQFFAFSRKVAESAAEIRRGEVRVTATFNGQELFAEYLAMSLMMQYFLFRWAKTLRSKTFWLATSLIVLAALFATATRGALIILAWGFIYLIAVGARVVPRAQSGKVIFIAIAVFYLAQGFVEPLVSHMMDRISTIGADDSSIQSRSIVLRQAIEAILAQPFLGHGIATATGTFRGHVSANIHNLYLTLAYTIGIPGLVAFVWMLVGLWRKTWSVFNDRSLQLSTRELALVLHVMFVMFVVDQIKIEYTRQPLYMHLVWLHFGFMMAIWKIASAQRRANAQPH